MAKQSDPDKMYAPLLKRISAVADSNKSLQKEIREMAKIFKDNQKVLVSMKGMMDVLSGSLEQIAGQSKQISMMEEDTKKIYESLSRAKLQEGIIAALGRQTKDLDARIKSMSEEGSREISQQVQDSADSIRNNTTMIIKIAKRVDEIRDDLKEVSGRTDSLRGIGDEIDRLNMRIDDMAKEASGAATGAKAVADLRGELERVTEQVGQAASLGSDLDSIKDAIDATAAKASRIDVLGGVMDGLRRQFELVASDVAATNSASARSVEELAGKIDRIETSVDTLAHRADATASVGESLKSVQSDLAGIRGEMLERTKEMEKRIAAASEMIKRQDASSMEFHKKAREMFSDIQSIRTAAAKASDDSAKEMMAMLKLSEYQSGIRMISESKYGEVADLERMARKTSDIGNLFDRITIETGREIPLPSDVRQWAVGNIMDAADRWEIRFGEVYAVLKNAMDKETLRRSVSMPQVRDIYGTATVDKIKRDLGM